MDWARLNVNPTVQVERVQDYSERCKDGVGLYIARNYSVLSSIEKEIPIVPIGCDSFRVPAITASLNNLTNSDSFSSLKEDFNWTNLMDVLGKGFSLQWGQVRECADCDRTGARCGFERESTGSDASSGRVVCLPRQASQQAANG